MVYRADSQGFTLIEAVVTMVVFAVAAISITTLISGLQTADRYTRYVDTARAEAKDKIEFLRNSNYSLLTDGQEIDFSDELPSSLPGPRRGTVAVSTPTGLEDLKRLDVTVSYTVGNLERQVKLSALVGASGLTQ